MLPCLDDLRAPLYTSVEDGYGPLPTVDAKESPPSSRATATAPKVAAAAGTLVSALITVANNVVRAPVARQKRAANFCALFHYAHTCSSARFDRSPVRR